MIQVTRTILDHHQTGILVIIKGVVYSAKLGRETLEIQKKDLLAANDRLARQYLSETDPQKRREILGALYELTKGLFQAWRVFGEENRRDYEQEIMVYLAQALTAFDPTRGPFVARLRFSVMEAQRQVGKSGRKTALTMSEDMDTEQGAEEETPDTLYWGKVKRQCTDTEWALLKARFFDGLTVEESATKAEVQVEQAKKTYAAILARIRLNHIPPLDPVAHPSTKNIQRNPSETDDGSKWVEKKYLRSRIPALTRQYLKDLLNPSRDPKACPFQIDPRDTLPLKGGLIRYLETSQGLLYPRFVRRKGS